MKKSSRQMYRYTGRIKTSKNLLNLDGHTWHGQGCQVQHPCNHNSSPQKQGGRTAVADLRRTVIFASLGLPSYSPTLQELQDLSIAVGCRDFSGSIAHPGNFLLRDDLWTQCKLGYPAVLRSQGSSDTVQVFQRDFICLSDHMETGFSQGRLRTFHHQRAGESHWCGDVSRDCSRDERSPNKKGF